MIDSGAESTEVPFFLRSTVRLDPVGSEVTDIVKEFSVPARPETNPSTVVSVTVPPCV